MFNLDNKTVMVTGGTGFFGKNFIKFLLKTQNPKKIIIFSRDESKQFRMEEKMRDDRLRFFIGDVREKDRLERALTGVDIIVHAAALKHVHLMEYNPFEGVRTNIFGTQNLINAAIDKQVEKVLLISTDKACHPVNLYGATKLCAEKLFASGNSYAAGKTKFSCVRYGNVLASRGSVVETLLSNPDAKKVSITDNKMTRFWISLKQTFDLVLFALENMEGGEIFIPKVPSMALADLFEAIAPKAKKEIIGIRPGEKMHEILISQDEARHTLELENYFIILPEFVYFAEELYDKYKKQGKNLPKDFKYASNTNKDWLLKDDIRKMLKLD